MGVYIEKIAGVGVRWNGRCSRLGTPSAVFFHL